MAEEVTRATGKPVARSVTEPTVGNGQFGDLPEPLGGRLGPEDRAPVACTSSRASSSQASAALAENLVLPGHAACSYS